MKNYNQSGQSLAEIIVALAILAFMSAAVVSWLAGSAGAVERGRDWLVADGLAKVGMAAVQSIGQRAWNELRCEKSAVTDENGRWELAGEGTTEQIGKYTREIDLAAMYRDPSGTVTDAASPGSYPDALSRLATVTIRWNRGNGGELVRQAYLTDWRAHRLRQSDWSGGSGQAIWSAANKYDSDNSGIAVGPSGELLLREIATSSYASEGSVISSAYNTGGSSYAMIRWEQLIPEICGDCAVRLQIETAADNGGTPGAWSATWCGPEGEDGDEDDFYTMATGELISPDHNGEQWIRYRAVMAGNGSETPVLAHVEIYYQ